jgi:predicted RND superfamily exporter protein
MLDAFGRFVLAARWPLLASLALVTAIAVYILPSARYDFTPQALFEQQDHTNRFAQEVRARFGDDTNTLMILWRTPADAGTVYAPTVLDGLRALTRDLEAIAAQPNSHITRVSSLANLRLPRNEPDPDDPGESLFDVSPLLPEEGPITPALAARVAANSAEHPLVRRLLVSNDARATAILIQLDEASRNIDTLTAAVGNIRDRLPAWERTLPGSPKLLLSGLPAVRTDIIATLRAEQGFFIPLAAALLMLGLLWMFRRLSGVLLPMGSVGLASLWTIAWIVLSGQPINIINNILPTLLMIIGLSDGIHMLSRMAEESGLGLDLDRRAAIRAMLKHMGLACFLTSLTSAIGFGSLALARTEILRNFGIDAAIGLMLVYVTSMTLIPIMLLWMKPPTRSALSSQRGGWLEKNLQRLTHLVYHRPRLTLLAGVLCAVAALVAGWRVEVNVFLLEAYPDDNPTAQLTRQMEDDFSGILPLIVSVEGDAPGYFRQPENLQKLAEFQRFIADRQGFVLSTLSIHDLLQAFRATYLRRPELTHQPLDNPAQIRTIFELYRRDAASDLSRLITADDRQALIIARIGDVGVKVAAEHIDAIKAASLTIFGPHALANLSAAESPDRGADDPLPPAEGAQIRFAGDIYVASNGLMTFIYDLLGSLALAAVLIFGVMTALFRSLRIGLISIIPNLLPLVMTFGLMGLRGIHINTSSIIIFSISLGLAVDDSIHFLARYQEECKRSGSLEEALLRTFNGAGRAIILTSALLIGGLGVLNFSDFIPTQLFSQLTAATVFGALIGDLFILPACLVLFDRKRWQDLPPLSPSPTSL